MGGNCTICDDDVGIGEQSLPLGSRADVHKAAHDCNRGKTIEIKTNRDLMEGGSAEAVRSYVLRCRCLVCADQPQSGVNPDLAGGECAIKSSAGHILSHR